MRDPLHWMPIKYKLPLAFVVLGFIAFAVGGRLVSRFAGEALDREIRERLSGSSRLASLLLDRELELLRSRCEDFASDGLIRELLDDPRGREVELGSHLARNKVPLVASFADCLAFDRDGRFVAAAASMDAVPSGGAGTLREAIETAQISAFSAAGAGNVEPTFDIAVPVRSLDRRRCAGSLVLRIRLGRFLHDALAAAPTEAHLRSAIAFSIEDQNGAAIRVPDWLLAAAAAGRPSALLSENESLPLDAQVAERVGGASRSNEMRSRVSLRSAPWHATTVLDGNAALTPLRDLESRYLLAGVTTAAVLVIGLSFVVKFLILPIGRLRDMAARMALGDLEARVEDAPADEIGDLARAFNSMADSIADRTRRLQAEHDRLGAVVDSMRDALVLLDPSGQVVLANEAARPFTQVLAGRSTLRLRHCPDGSPADACAGCLRAGRRHGRDCMLEVGDRAYEVIESDLSLDDGATAGRVLVARDVTERLVMNEVQAQQERLSVLGEVSAVVAHEINNPLAAISMFNQMMADRLDDDSPFRENVDVIARNTETCKRAVRDLLDHALAADSETGEVDLVATLRDVVRFLRPVFDRASVPLVLDAPTTEAVVVGDEIRLRQVFVNLAVNALQAQEDRGGGAVRISVTPTAGAHIVDVIDHGPGIADEIRERVFEPFFTTKGGRRGTGLGLPTSRRSIEAIGGRLEIHASGAQGSTFRVTLPRAASPSRDDARSVEPKVLA